MIYFIKSESGHVKIGYTNNKIENRLSALQCGNPFELSLLKIIDGDREQEWLIHQKFKEKRCKGEWFLLDQELLNYIERPYTIIPKPKNNSVCHIKNTFMSSCATPLLCSYMNEKKMNVTDLSEATGLTRAAIYTIINGKSSASFRTAQKFYNVLEMPIETWI